MTAARKHAHIARPVVPPPAPIDAHEDVDDEPRGQVYRRLS